MNARLVLYAILAAVMGVSWIGACVIYRAAELGELVAPIDPWKSGPLGAVVVGSGGGFENPERAGPAIAIGWADRVVLVDAGRSVGEALRTARIPLAQPEAVLLTNLLGENTVGLNDLLLTGWRQPRTQPLRVYGPPGTAAMCEAIVEAHKAGIEAEGPGRGLPPEGAQLLGFDVEPGWTASLEGLEITAWELPGGPIPALAWRFDSQGRSVTVAGAGWAPDAVVEAAKGSDVLIHEAVITPPAEEAEEAGMIIDPELLRLEAALHTQVVDVGGIAQRAGVDTLVLVRMRPPAFYNWQIEGTVAQSFDGEVVIAADAEEIDVPRPRL